MLRPYRGGLCRTLDIDFRESGSRHSGEYNLRKSAREVGKRRAQEVEESSPILPNTLTVRMLYESRIEAWGKRYCSLFVEDLTS